MWINLVSNVILNWFDRRWQRSVKRIKDSVQWLEKFFTRSTVIFRSIDVSEKFLRKEMSRRYERIVHLKIMADTYFDFFLLLLLLTHRTVLSSLRLRLGGGARTFPKPAILLYGYLSCFPSQYSVLLCSNVVSKMYFRYLHVI